MRKTNAYSEKIIRQGGVPKKYRAKLPELGKKAKEQFKAINQCNINKEMQDKLLEKEFERNMDGLVK